MVFLGFALCIYFSQVASAIILKSIPIYGAPPLARSNAESIYDNSTGCLYLFGGLSNNEEYLNDIWSFDFINLNWKKINPSNSIAPEPSLNFMLFNDEDKGLFIKYGGRNDHGISSDFWSFDIKNQKVFCI